jgi:hypothetical protein
MQQELANERRSHDATKAALKQAQDQLAALAGTGGDDDAGGQG